MGHQPKYLVLYWDAYDTSWQIWGYSTSRREARRFYNNCKREHEFVRLCAISVLLSQDQDY